MPFFKKGPPDTIKNYYNKALRKLFREYPFQTRYAITVSPHQKDASLGDIVHSTHDIHKMYKGALAILYTQETSKLGKQHLHGIIFMRQPCKFAKLRKHPLCQFYFKPYDEREEWLSYMGKEQPDNIFLHLNPKYFPQYEPLQALELDWYGFQ